MITKRSLLKTVAAAALATLALLAISTSPARASEALADQKLCLNCHKVDKPQVGPAFKAVADKVRDALKA